MKYAYCFLGVVPVRKQPISSSEQITQLIFGDFVEILSLKDGWAEVCNINDNYVGYVDSRNILPVERKRKNKYFSTNMFSYIQMDKELIPIPFGAKLLGTNYTLANHHFSLPHKHFSSFLPFSKENLREFVLPFLNTPYLWGGKNPMGIDCSGFTQLIYSCFSKDLPRDAYQQAELGETVPSIFAAKEGDLCFFGEKEKITHVGIFLEKQYIIHASGRVRIDLVDNNGITDHSTGEYTHSLLKIKRFF